MSSTESVKSGKSFLRNCVVLHRKYCFVTQQVRVWALEALHPLKGDQFKWVNNKAEASSIHARFGVQATITHLNDTTGENLRTRKMDLTNINRQSDHVKDSVSSVYTASIVLLNVRHH